MPKEKYILCVNCRATFSEEEVKGWGCPSCGNKGVPADTRAKSTVTLTSHEWKILTIWADNWARRVCAEKDQEGNDSVACITAILNEMRRQAPEMSGLTMGEQVQEVADHLGTTVESVVDGETEIIKPAKRH
jgi:predicted  nucleic acid-binding Zn-ribbon protein